MKGIMKKVTAMFMAMVMVLSCVVVGGTTAKAADYYFNPEEYDMRYILSNYQVYVKGNLTTTNSGHQVGSIAVGGSAYLSNTFGNASIAPSYIYHVATQFNTNDYYSELKDSPYADLHNLYVYYTEIEQGINLNSHPTIFEQKDSYINMDAAFTAIENQSQQMAQVGEEVHVSSDGYIYLDVSNKNEEHTYIISEEDFLKAKAIRFKGTNGDLSAFRNKERPITVSVKGLDDTDVNVEFNQEGMVDAPVIGIYWDTNPSETEDTYASFANALKKLDGPEGYNSNYQVAPKGTNVLFNFPEVTKTLYAGLLSGQLVAPKAHVSIGGGNYEGCFIGASAHVDAEGHFYPYYEMGTAIADAPLKPYIAGGDFLITVQDASNATEETVIDLAKALRHATVGAPGDADDVAVDNLSDLKQKSEPGKVPVTLVDGSTETKKAPSKEVIATVVEKKSTNFYWNNTQNEFIQLGANNFEMSKKQAEAYTANKNGDAEKALVKALANAVALQDGNTVEQSEITIISDNIQPISGTTYQVTFGYKNTQVMVEVTVKDDGPTDNVGNPTDIPSVNLTANNFTVNGGSATLTEDAFIVKAEVVAKNNDGSSRQDIKVDAQDLANLNDKIKNAVAGDYPVDVTSGGVTTTVMVTVVSGYPFISADDFIIQVEETATADAGKVKDWSNAGRIPEAGQVADATKVDVSNLNDLKNQNEAGVVDVVLKDNTSDVNKAVDRTVVATVVDVKKVEVVDGAEVVIGANNFNISKAQAKAVVDNTPSKDATEAMIKILANAVATDDGNAVNPEDITVDASAIRAEENIYDVIFTYKGQSVTVKATVKDDGPTDKATDKTDVPSINLTANDFSVEAKSPAISADAFKVTAKVEANYNTGETIPSADIAVNTTQLDALNAKIAEGVAGEYEVDVTTGGVTTTVTVTVTEKYPKVEANDFIISVDDAKNVTADKIKELSDTKRYESPSEETTGTDKGTENVNVPTTEVDELKGVTEPGSVEITIKDENSNAADDQTVKATVVDKTEASDDGKVVIGANHYNISMRQAEAIVDSLADPNAKPDKAATDLMNKILANAVATDEGTAVDRNNIAVDASDIDAVPDTYQVTFTYKGESVTVNVTVKDDGSTDGADDPTRVPGVNLTANDFSVVGGSPALTPQNFINLADVTANNNDGSKRNDIEVNAADLAVLNQKIAVAVDDQHVVEVMSGGVTTKVTVTITKPVTYPKVNANDFIVDIDDVKNLTPEDVRELSDAKRYLTPEEEKDDMESNSDQIIVPDITDLTGRTEPGSVDLTLKDGNQDPAEDKPVTAIVVDETTTSQDEKIVIGANNFNVSIEQAKAIQNNPTANGVLTMVKTLANAVATDEGKAVKRKDIAIQDVTVIKPENGTYDVTFTYGGESVTVKATVKDAGAGDNKPAEAPDVNLTGNDFAVEAGSAPLTEDTFKDVPNADVEANYNDGSSVPDDKVKVNPEDLAKLNDAIEKGETGPVDVKVTVDDKTAVITVTVADEKEVNDNNKETVAANNFEVKLSEYDSVVNSKDELVKRAEAFAYDTETRADVEIVKATVKDPKKEIGTYDVTFVTEKGSEVTVKMTVVDDSAAGDETYPKLDANDFIVDVDDLKGLTPEDVKDLSDTNRYTTPEEEKDGKDNGSDKVTVPDITDLTGRTEPGSVDLTLKDGNQDPAKDKPIKAIVVDETTTSKDGKIVVGANNFNVTIRQAQAIQNNPKDEAVLTMVKTLANAVATDNGNAVERKDIAIQDVTVIKPENGTYDVTFTYGGESVTVKATVKDDGAGDNSDNPTKLPDVNLTGNDFAVEAGSDPLTEEAFKDVPYADVEANYNDGSSVPDHKVKVNPEDLEKLNDAIKKGETGPVVVEVYVDDKKTEVTVTVTDKKTVDNGNKETIAANNFEIKLSEYDAVVDSKEELVKRAQAFAYDTDTRADVEIAKATVKDPKKEIGTYDVTFSTAKGSSVTVKMTVVSGDSNITAKDFSVAAGSNPLTPEEFVKKAEVTAKKDDGTPITTVTVDPTDLATLNKAIEEGKVGPQKVKVTAEGKSTTVTVTVTKGDDIKGQDKIFELSNPQDVPQILADGRTVKTVNVDGKDIPANSYVVSGNEMKIKSPVFQDKKEGVYPVVITYTDGSKHTFNVTVVPYNKDTVVTKVPIFHMQKDLGLGKKFKINLVGMTKYSIKKFKTSNKRIATVDKNGVIKGKKIGKCKITATIIQNGSYYTVKIDLHVKKSMKMYNLKKRALQKKEGNLPEFNVYKRVVKGKKTKMKFTNISKDAKVTYTSSNKKVATVSKKGVIKGKKKGFTIVTAKIEQNGHTYYTKLIVRVDDGTPNKDLKKYLK